MSETPSATILVSSRATLFWRWGLPVFWLTFMGLFNLLVLFGQPFKGNSSISPLSAKILLSSFFVSSIALMMLSIFRLKRVEIGESHWYVSNYFSTLRYTFDSIQRIDYLNMVLFRTVVFQLHQRGKLGRNIIFIPGSKWQLLLNENPDFKAFVEQLEQVSKA